MIMQKHTGQLLHITRVIVFAPIWAFSILVLFDCLGSLTGLFELSGTGINLVYLALVVFGVDRFQAYSWSLKQKADIRKNGP